MLRFNPIVKCVLSTCAKLRLGTKFRIRKSTISFFITMEVFGITKMSFISGTKVRWVCYVYNLECINGRGSFIIGHKVVCVDSLMKSRLK